ncbi:ABCA3.2 family protein [Megaselia abdita]
MIELLYFVGFSIFCLLSVILVDSKVFTKKIDPIELSYQEPDEDVLREKIRAVSINRKQLFQTAIVMKDVTKVYDNEIAVKNLTMRIEEGESFGFIGLAGSGKSTVLNILSGETIPNRGGAYYRGRSLITKRKQCQKEIGYCPDASYYDDFTINEYIKVFLMIHGYNRKDVKRMPLEFASAFMFSHHIKKKLKDCSKYTKKKINLSVTLIGCPKLVMIDEPTIGLDPFKSEVIWKIINGMRRSGKTVIISTFSVKEASELCDRIGILCNGELINVGTKSEILSRFGEGWILQIRVNERAMKEAGQSRSLKFFENIDEFVTLSFFGAILREKIGLSIQFFVPITPEIGVRWSRTFRMMEANKERLGIEDYSVSVVNVKEVYLIRTENQAELKPNK